LGFGFWVLGFGFWVLGFGRKHAVGVDCNLPARFPASRAARTARLPKISPLPPFFHGGRGVGGEGYRSPVTRGTPGWMISPAALTTLSREPRRTCVSKPLRVLSSERAATGLRPQTPTELQNARFTNARRTTHVARLFRRSTKARRVATWRRGSGVSRGQGVPVRFIQTLGIPALRAPSMSYSGESPM
jgi:hypothetical protein